MPRAPRLLSALLVVAALSTSAVFSLEARHGAATPRPKASSVKAPQSVLPDFWKTLTHLWAEVGCSVDPYGGCIKASVSNPPHPTVDVGCTIDPYGSSCAH
jgi:hypothetical protein